MPKTEQRAFAAITAAGNVVMASVSKEAAVAQTRATAVYANRWADLEAVGWRIRPVIIRVEDEGEG